MGHHPHKRINAVILEVGFYKMMSLAPLAPSLSPLALPLWVELEQAIETMVT